MDSTAVFAFHDHPFEETPIIDPSSYDFFAGNPNPPLDDDQTYFNFDPSQPGQELNDILDADDPLLDPAIWAFCNGTEDGTGNSPAGHSTFAGEGCSSHAIDGDFNNAPEIPIFEDQPMPISVFSVPQSPYNCTFCQILREITHTNGMNVKRLEIHGIFGVITHAVLGIYDFDSSSQSQDYQMFDFQNESMQTVKKFLVQYLEACKQEGYNILQDPLSTFYEALCVGLNEPEDNLDDFCQFTPESAGDCVFNEQETLKKREGGSNQMGSMKIPLAMQRERTRNLKLKDFIDYFDLPIEDAARKMNICPTVLKKICRRNGVLRWPYRKIKSIKRKISKKTKILDASGDFDERTGAMEDIHKHKQELAKIYQEFTG
ncbi:hypothetical protein ABFX02_02G131300 [Erythranthe guttata]